MKKNIKNFSNEIFLSIILISINIFFNDFNPLINYIFLIIFILLKFDSKIYNPFLYIFAGSIYLLPIIYKFSFSNTIELRQYINLLTIGILIFSFIYNFFTKLEKKIKKFKKINYQKVDICLFLSYLLYSFFHLNYLNLSNEIFRGLSYLTNYFIIGSIFGSLLVISKKSLIESYIKSIPYLIILILENFYENASISRIYIIFYIVLIYILTIGSTNNLRFTIFHKLNENVNEYLFKLIYTSLFFIYISVGKILTGGDFMVIKHALAILRINNFYERFEPFMPFHNGFFIYFPKNILPFIKPENYNSSAWIIENIYKADPALVSNGAGSSLVGASFIYGGTLGVILSFLILGIFLIFIEKYIDSIFFLGFYASILIKLPITIVRMDETFLVGTFISFILLFPLFHKFIKKFIYL